jgi:hypothetical protein
MGWPPNRPNPARASRLPGFAKVDSMPVIEAELKPIPSIVPVDPPDILDMSDDECLARLAVVVEAQDLEHLDLEHLEEMAWLIARLAVTIE